MVCITSDQPVEELVIKRKGGGSVINHRPLFSDNGQIIYVIWGNVVRAYSVQTGELLRDYEGLIDNIVAVHFHPYNSKLLIACSESGEIGFWKWKSGIYHNKIQIKLDNKFCISTFDLVAIDKGAILISWKHIDKGKKYHFGLFNLQNGTLKTKIEVSLKSASFKLSIGGRPGSQFLSIVQLNKLYTIDLSMKLPLSLKYISENSSFTCVECHPEYYFVLTGETTGRVILWQGILCEERSAQAIYHWHTLPVACLAFTKSGSHFYSGGHERVLVKWTVDNPNHRSTLPRLPGGVCHIAVGPENHRVAICTQDNGVQILDAQNRIISCIQHFAWGVYVDLKDSVNVPKTNAEPPFPAGLVYDPTTQSIVLNGQTGHVQFYSTHSKSLLYKVDITLQNQLTAERNLDIINTSVVLVAIGVLSDQSTDLRTWMATIEHRDDSVTHFESRLKFWEYNSAKQIYSLNTCIDHPHNGRVCDIKFQEIGKQFLCASVGKDNLLKIWKFMESTPIHKKRHWQCVGSVKHKDLPANCINFSMDGSLLACGFGPCVTIWRPDDLSLKCSLTHVGPQSDVKKVLFGCGDMGHLLVSCNASHLVVWDVMSLRSLWMVNISVAILVGDPVSTHMAAFSEDNTLFVFKPSECSPIYTKDLSQLTKIKHAVWVPNQNIYNYKISWQENSQLYFLDSNQELLCLESSTEEDYATSSTTSEQPPHVPGTAFGAMMAMQRRSGVSTVAQNIHSTIGVPGSNSIKEFLVPAPHAMAPVHLLCGGLLRALLGVQPPVKKSKSLNKSTNEDVMEIDTSDDEDNRPKRSNKDDLVPVKKEPTKIDSNKHSTELEAIFKENDKWVNVIA
ncbi:WD repeat-containing protein 75-like [Ctenocephalides felis]|uniref:WD repeat-containing protein 75-like n=1 Tax=Ctenocephalides felis TaxID=7515 RepID=UPI000E6E42BA|nr:WD repeat-containing protein 75-like [Ctenocephalides felis]